MRRFLAVSILLSAGGCADGDQPAISQRLTSKSCAMVAETRMGDARLGGYDGNAQAIVFRGSYADCVKWQAKGFEPEIP
jgi:hypothetical protein